MAHCAEIDENGKVKRVIVVHDNYGDLTCEQWCEKTFGGKWKQTSYNTKLRKNYAGVGFTYDEGRDAFIPPKPYKSWVLNEDTCLWEAPVPLPLDGKDYIWDEKLKIWKERI